MRRRHARQAAVCHSLRIRPSAGDRRGSLMPEMELFGPDLHLSLISGIWNPLLSYMFWPDDERQRQAFCTLPLVQALSSIDEKSTSDPNYAIAYRIVHEAFRRGHGWRVLNKAGFVSPEGRGEPLRTAAAILDIIRGTPRDGSLNKAVHVVGETAKTFRLIRNRTGTFEAWKSHRDCMLHAQHRSELTPSPRKIPSRAVDGPHQERVPPDAPDLPRPSLSAPLDSINPHCSTRSSSTATGYWRRCALMLHCAISRW